MKKYDGMTDDALSSILVDNFSMECTAENLLDFICMHADLNFEKKIEFLKFIIKVHDKIKRSDAGIHCEMKRRESAKRGVQE